MISPLVILDYSYTLVTLASNHERKTREIGRGEGVGASLIWDRLPNLKFLSHLKANRTCLHKSSRTDTTDRANERTVYGWELTKKIGHSPENSEVVPLMCVPVCVSVRVWMVKFKPLKQAHCTLYIYSYVRKKVLEYKKCN